MSIHDEDAVVRGLGLDCSTDDHLDDVDEKRFASDCRNTSFSCRTRLRIDTYLCVMAYTSITVDPKAYFHENGKHLHQGRCVDSSCAHELMTS
jgi:hypothetical protein